MKLRLYSFIGVLNRALHTCISIAKKLKSKASELISRNVKRLRLHEHLTSFKILLKSRLTQIYSYLLPYFTPKVKMAVGMIALVILSIPINKQIQKIEIVQTVDSSQEVVNLSATSRAEVVFKYDYNLTFKTKLLQKIVRPAIAESKDNVAVFYDFDGREMNVNSEVARINYDEYKINIPQNKLPPGEYTIDLKVEKDGVFFQQEKHFAYGVLALNTNKASYLPGEKAHLQLAALRSDGHTICDANLNLEITDPDGNTKTPLVERSGKCKRDNVTNVPDYSAYYKVGGTGKYEMKLINQDTGYQIVDEFEVVEEKPFDITRKGPTRIFPFVKYPMTLEINANEDFSGEIIDRVPVDFEIKRKTRIKNNYKEIFWVVDLKKGDKVTLDYFFDAPDISPFLYVAGPASLGNYGESRQWQIASDADGSGAITVTPSVVAVSATDQTFEFTFDPSETMDSGELAIKVPTSRGWSTPQGTAGTAGYTTVTGSGNTTLGDVLVTADSLSEGVWTMSEDDSDMCNTTSTPFLDTSIFAEGTGSIQCDNSSSTAPDNGDTLSFEATTNQDWASYDQISFWFRSTKSLDSTNGVDFGYDNATNFTGPNQIIDTGTVSPNTWVYYYSDLTGSRNGISSVGLICDGTGCGSSKFWLDEIMLGPGTPTFVANGSDVDIRARFIDLASTDLITVTYGAGGGTSGADVPTSAAVDEFTTRTRTDSGGTLTNVSDHPDINVQAPGIDISGTCKQSDQSTNCTDTGTVKYAINGTLGSEVQSIVGGTWTISGATTPSSGDVVTVFIDGAGEGNEAVAVTKYDGSGNITGVNLIEERLTIGSDDNQTLSNTNLSQYDNSVSADEDIFFDVDGGNDLSMTETSKTDPGMYIKTGNTYQPASGGGGDFTTRELDVIGTLTLDSNTITLTGGGTPLVVSGTLNANTSIFRYTSTTTTSIVSGTYHHLTLAPSAAGGPTYTLGSSSFDINGNLTVGDGTNPVTVNWDTNDPSIAVGGSFVRNNNTTWTKSGSATLTMDSTTSPVNLTDNNATKQNLGILTIDGPKEVDITTSITAEKINVTTGDTLDLQSSGYVLTITGSGTGGSRPFIVAGSLTEGTNSTVVYTGSSDTAIDDEYYYNLTLDQAGTNFTANGTVNINGGVFWIKDGTFNAGSNIISIVSSGNAFVIDGTFNEDTSYVSFISTSSVNIPAVDYYDLVLNGSTSGTKTYLANSGTINITNELQVGRFYPGSLGYGVFDIDTNDATVNVGGDLIMWYEWTIEASSNTANPLNLKGDFHEYGTGDFNHNNGKVILSGVKDSTQSIYGSHTFYNLEIESGDRIVNFPASTTTSVASGGAFTLTGTDCENLIRVRSSSTATQSTIDIDSSATVDLSHIDFQDIAFSTKSVTAVNSSNSGNNSGTLTISPSGCIGTSTDQDASGASFQRKVVYDSENQVYWSFNHDGDEIEVKYSDDGGSTWDIPTTAASGHLAYDTNDFSVWWKSISSTEYIVLAVNDGGVIKLRQGTLTASDITWDGDVSTVLTGTGDYSYPYVTLDSSDYIWVGARYTEASNSNFQTTISDQLVTADPSTWTWTDSYQISDSTTSANVYGTIEPLSSQNMYATFAVDTDLLGCKWDNTAGEWQDSSSASCLSTSSSGGEDTEGSSARSDSGPNKIDDAGDPGTMPGAGGQIVQTSAGALYSFINDGGSCEVWKSSDGGTWTEQDSGDNPTCISATAVAMAIKSDDNIGLTYVVTGYPQNIKYIEFDTDTDQFQTEETVTTTSSIGNTYELSIDFDSLDTPHVVYKLRSAMDQSMYYVNKVGGSWNSRVSLAGGEGVDVNSVDITLDGNDIPIISYYFGALFDLYIASGNTRNATSFSNDAIDTSAGGESAIDIDINGDAWIVYKDTTSISLAKHISGDNWATWSTITTKTDVGSSLSISIIGSSIVVFYNDDSSDQKAVYDIYDSGTSSWLGETVLASTGSVDYQNVKVRQSRYNQTQPWMLDYVYSDGTDIYWDVLDLRPTKVDDASDFGAINGAGRQIVRNSKGDLYTFVNNSGSCEVWKSTDGFLWTEIDSANNPSCLSGSTISLGVDSSDLLHLTYRTFSSSYSYVWYNTVSTSDQFGGSPEEVGASISNSSKDFLNLALDSNDIPHIAFASVLSSDVYYDNRIGGTWMTTTVIVEDVSGFNNISALSMTINEDNVPEIAYINSLDDLTVAIGDDNDPDTAGQWTVHDVDTDINHTSDERGLSIAVDAQTGDTWVAYVDSDSTIALATHTGTTWASNWSTITSKTDVGYQPSITIDGSYGIHVFYQNDETDQQIAYDVYDSKADTPVWSGESVLYSVSGVDLKNVQTKWSFEYNNFGINKIDYLFSDGTDIYWDYLYLRKEPTIIDDAGDPGTFTGMGSRLLRTSDGTLYMTFNNNGDLEVWKSMDGRTFVEMDSGDGPTDINAPDEVATAIDSSDIIHIIYVNNTDPEDVNYVTFDTSSDQFGSSETAINVFATGNSFRGIDIAIDSNDIPHIVGARYGTQDRMYYGNRIGGSWNSIDDVYTGVAMYKPSLTINEDDVAEVSFYDSNNDDLIAGVGNANNATSFSTQAVESTLFSTNTIQATDIGVDSTGNTWITYIDDSTQYVGLIKHNDSDAWTSWQTEVNNSRVGSTPSLAIQGTDVFVFYENTQDDIVYDVYDGSSWRGEHILEQHGALQDVKVKWSFLNNYDSTGSAPVEINTYYFDGSDAGATDPDSVWTNDSYAFNGSTATGASASLIGSASTNFIKAEGTNSPVRNRTIDSVQARIFSEGNVVSYVISGIYTDNEGELLGEINGHVDDIGWEDYENLSTPSGGWTWEKIQSLESKSYIENSNQLNSLMRIEILVKSTDTVAQNEIDYVYSDGTDIYYNRLKIGNSSVPGSTDEIFTGLATSLSQNFSTVKRTVSSTDYIHTAYVNSSGNIYYDLYDGDWDFTATQVDSNTDNTYLTLSADTSTNDLYLGSIRSSTDDIYTKKATYSAGPSWSWGSSSTLRTDASEIYTNFTQNYSSGGQIGGILSVGDASPYMLGWETVLATSANNAPTVTSVSVNGSSDIDLTANSVYQVDWTSTVTDVDGFADISSVNGKLYRSGASGAETCTPDDNNCYVDASCQLSGCSGNVCTATCSADVKFFADPTDSGTYAAEYWRGWVEAVDSASATAEGFSAVDSVDINSLTAISLDTEIDYATVIAGDNSTEKTIDITNIGNVLLDSELSGDDLCSDYPTCAGGSIGVGNQEYSSSSFTYGSGTDLTGTPATLTLNLSKSSVSPSNSTDTIYWRLGIPGTQGTGVYNGQNTVVGKKV